MKLGDAVPQKMSDQMRVDSGFPVYAYPGECGSLDAPEFIPVGAVERVEYWTGLEGRAFPAQMFCIRGMR